MHSFSVCDPLTGMQTWFDLMVFIHWYGAKQQALTSSVNGQWNRHNSCKLFHSAAHVSPQYHLACHAVCQCGCRGRVSDQRCYGPLNNFSAPTLLYMHTFTVRCCATWLPVPLTSHLTLSVVVQANSFLRACCRRELCKLPRLRTKPRF